MEQLRFVIAIVLCLLVFIVWDHFFVQPLPKNVPVNESTKTEKTQPIVPPPDNPPSQNLSTQPVPSPDMAKIKKQELDTQSAPSLSRILTVVTSLYTAKINEANGAITSFVLNQYKETHTPDSKNKELIDPSLKTGTMHFQFDSANIPELQNLSFSANLSSDAIQVFKTPQAIVLSVTTDNQITIKKEYTFYPTLYLIDLSITIINQSANTLPKSNVILKQLNVLPEQKRMIGFVGPCAFIDNQLKKIKISDIKDNDIYKGNLNWMTYQDRYFMTSIIPQKDNTGVFMRLFKSDKIIESQMIAPFDPLPPATQHAYKYQLYLGPKSVSLLKDIGFNLDQAVDFGMFDSLAKICLYLMNFLYKFIPNYGVAIIILTLLIKIVCWPLGNKSYKSMNEMKKLQPLMADIREKYGKDKKKMNEEIMNLYKIYKINPLSGCLPMVVQMPILFALYRMLYEAIELRHSPFVFWITDLSAPDRLFEFHFSIPFMQPPYGIPVLTILMGATMLFQQKLSPPPGDPAQAKMMMIMPIVFTFIFINFSSGLVLYWLVNNVLSIAQQYYITKKYS